MNRRAAVIVTGTEVLTGRVTDRNGPWLAEQLRELGVDIGQVIVVGDRPHDLEAALTFLRDSGADLILTSGGLGPTADDLTAEIVGRVQGRPSALDPALQDRIAAIIERLNATRVSAERSRAEQRARMDPAALAAGVRKQAMVPVGASVLEPVGTAPGLVVPPADGASGPPVVVLPGPPRELQGMWPAVLVDPLVAQALAGRTELRQRTIRLWGTGEAELAATLREHQDVLTDLEITTCLRDGELEIVTRYRPGAEETYRRFESLMTAVYADTVFSTDGATVTELVGRQLSAAGLTIATAESCTAGLLAARLTEIPGSSGYFLGGIVSYANAVKQNLLGVDADLIGSVGAVSAEVALAMADGVRSRLGADLGVGITGIAGPGGGTATKPVGLVHLAVTGAGESLQRRIVVPGSREDVRTRAVAVAQHLLRDALGRSAARSGDRPAGSERSA